MSKHALARINENIRAGYYTSQPMDTADLDDLESVLSWYSSQIDWFIAETESTQSYDDSGDFLHKSFLDEFYEGDQT